MMRNRSGMTTIVGSRRNTGHTNSWLLAKPRIMSHFDVLSGWLFTNWVARWSIASGSHTHLRLFVVVIECGSMMRIVMWGYLLAIGHSFQLLLTRMFKNTPIRLLNAFEVFAESVVSWRLDHVVLSVARVTVSGMSIVSCIFFVFTA